MDKLTYRAVPILQKLAEKATREWNKILSGLVELKALPAGTLSNADISIVFGTVNRSNQPTRVAECNTIDVPDQPRKWRIILASDVKWQITAFERFLGIGTENAYGAILHEIGHVFTFPHSTTTYHIMSPNLGSTVFSTDEIAGLRAYFIKYLK